MSTSVVEFFVERDGCCGPWRVLKETWDPARGRPAMHIGATIVSEHRWWWIADLKATLLNRREGGKQVKV